MTTNLYILVNGTSIAKPNEDPMEIMWDMQADSGKKLYSSELNRKIFGSSTSILVQSDDGAYMIDSGHIHTIRVMSKSLKALRKELKVDIRNMDIPIYLSHSHQDHIGNLHLFPYAKWMINQKDVLLEAVLAEKVPERFKQWQEWYKRVRDKISPNQFAWYNCNTFRHDDATHAHSVPRGLEIIAAPGHERSHDIFRITDSEGINIINLETKRRFDLKGPVLYVGDVFVDELHLQKYREGNLKLAISGSVIPTEQHPNFKDQEERDRMHKQHNQSQGKVLGLARYMLMGHSGAIYDCDKKLFLGVKKTI